MKKFWTVINGVLGTAHNARDGRVVDFRPVDRTEVRDELLVIHPPRGQEGAISKATIEPTRVEKRVVRLDYPLAGQQWVEKIFYAQYMGVEISATSQPFAEWHDHEAEEKARQEAEEWTADWQATKKEKLEFLKSLSNEELVAKANASEIGRLRSGTLEIRAIVARIMREEFERRFGGAGQEWWKISHEIDRRDLEKLKADLLAYDDRCREERKQRWLEKPGGEAQ